MRSSLRLGAIALGAAMLLGVIVACSTTDTEARHGEPASQVQKGTASDLTPVTGEGQESAEQEDSSDGKLKPVTGE